MVKKHKKNTKETPIMTAKVRHKQRCLEYLSNWDNPFPTAKLQLAPICGIKLDTFYFHFTPAEINEILTEGLELRKKYAAIPRAEAYEGLRKAAKDGVVPAAKEILDRIEGKVVEKIQHRFDGSALTEILSALPSKEYADAVKAKLSELSKKSST